MMLVDRALAEREQAGDPVRVAMLGAGFMGRGLVNQVVNSVPGMEIVAIVNRHADKAEAAYAEAGVTDVARVTTAAEVDRAIASGRPAVSDDPALITGAGRVDAIVDVTGAVEYGAAAALDAIANGKHLVLMNAELDGTVGPILKVKADAAGVVYTACDGDQPGVQGNLYRYVRGLGLQPLVVGNIKGLHDPYRNPTTQEGFARKWGQNPWMVTSFADGTKISYEQALVANAFDLTVARRGMLGWDHDGHVDELTGRFDVEELRELGGIVDYVVKARPGPGVFLLAAHDDPKQRHYLNLYKLGEGPLYSFYTPWHLCHFEVPNSVARAVLFGDATLAPTGGPKVSVVAAAKRPLRAGETLDGLGGYCTYGLAERTATAHDEHLLDLGLAEGAVMVRDVERDRVLTRDDVRLPEGRLSDRLVREQREHFGESKETRET